jgi:type IV pilus assembly protein PilQ
MNRFSEKIRGLVSLNLVDVSWRRAFDTLLEVHGLAMERHGDVIWVAPLTELAAREIALRGSCARRGPRAAE